MITTTEWLEELRRLTERSDDGLSVAEIAEALGTTLSTARKYLTQANAAGLLVLGFRFRTALDGKRCRTPVYSFKEVKP